LLGRAILIEGGLLGIALIWARLARIPLGQQFSPIFPQVWIGFGLGGSVLMMSGVIVLYGTRYFAWCRRIKNLVEQEVAPLFCGFSVASTALIALISGLSEEVLFRGVLQSQIGLVGASVLFGLAHVWRKDAVVYGVYATFIGALLGGVYAVTQNLWGPVTAHVLNNFVAILYCRQLPECRQRHESM
jgi:membrane protease YdiL (CAAX protease family)